MSEVKIVVVKQPLPGEAWKKAVTPWNDPEFVNNYPQLHAYMVQDKWESGSPRQTATLTMFCDSGGLTVILNDRANLRSLFVQEESLFTCLTKIEESLESNTADWRVKRNGQNPFDRATPF